MVWCQSPTDDISSDSFDGAFLSGLIEKKVNKIRKDSGLVQLTQDPELTAASINHVGFINRLGRITHDQPSKKMATPGQRVLAAGGLHADVTENCQSVLIGAKTRVAGSRQRVILKTYEQVADAIVKGWLHNKRVKETLLSPEYYNVGTATGADKDKGLIYATQVYGSEPFIAPPGARFSKKAFGIKPYSRSECIDIEKDYPYLPELLSNNIYFEKGKIYFYFHDLFLFKEFMKNGKDAVALDIVTRDQFSCKTGNRLYPSTLHRGVLLKPVKKGKMLKKNELKEGGELWTAMAELPAWVDTNNTEFNLLIIKNKCLCQSIYYNNVGGENLSLLGLDWAMDTVRVSQDADSLKRTLEFDIPFEQGKYNYQLEDIKAFLDSVELNKYNIKSITLTAYSSIEGSQQVNQTLQKKRAESILKAIEEYKLQDVKTTINTKENWDEFMTLIGESPYAKKFAKMSKEEIRAFVNSDTVSINLEPYLRDQRKAHISIYVESVFVDAKLVKVLKQRMRDAIAAEDVVQAKAIQTILVSEARKGKLRMEEVLSFDIPQKKSLLSLYSNQLALKALHYKGAAKDSLYRALRSRLIALLAIDDVNPYLLYNKHLSTLWLWSKDTSFVKDPVALFKDIKKLYNTRVPNYMVNRLMVNYNIIAADYYYDKKKFTERDKALREVKKFLLKSNLDRDQTYEISSYFMYQMKLEWAIEIMMPFVVREDIDEDFLFTFLSIAIYDKEQVPRKLFLTLIERSRKMNNNRFCKLLGYPNMSFQLLEDSDIKRAYCASCND